MVSKMYACLECGFVHDGKKTERKRIDVDKSANRCFCSMKFHGYMTYRICPECKHEEQIKIESDKE